MGYREDRRHLVEKSRIEELEEGDKLLRHRRTGVIVSHERNRSSEQLAAVFGSTSLNSRAEKSQIKRLVAIKTDASSAKRKYNIFQSPVETALYRLNETEERAFLACHRQNLIERRLHKRRIRFKELLS